MDVNFSEIARFAESRPTLVLSATASGGLALVAAVTLLPFDSCAAFREALGMSSVFALWILVLSVIGFFSVMVTLIVTKPKAVQEAQLVEHDPTASLTDHELWHLVEFVRANIRELPLTDAVEVRSLVRLKHLRSSTSHKAYVIDDHIFDYIRDHRDEVAKRLPPGGAPPERSASTPPVEKRPPPLQRSTSFWRR